MLKQNWNQLEILCEEQRPRYINGKEIPNWQKRSNCLGGCELLRLERLAAGFLGFFHFMAWPWKADSRAPETMMGLCSIRFSKKETFLMN